MAYTSFFRDADALAGISDVVIPALAHWRSIRVWDAGCATGEEPYTLAMVFAAQIAAARYSRKDIFWVPEPFREAYLVPTGDPEQFEVAAEVREKVRYVQHDLLTLEPPETGQSLIVCKNVLMHFSPEDQVRVLEMFHRCLAPGGYLAMDGNQALPAVFAGRFLAIGPGVPVFQKPAD